MLQNLFQVLEMSTENDFFIMYLKKYSNEQPPKSWRRQKYYELKI